MLRRHYAPAARAGKVTGWKVYFQDESCFGLLTVLRRAITLPGVKPVGAFQHRFPYRYCYSLVDPLEGDLFFVTAPQVNTLYFEYLLSEFSRHEPQTMKFVFLDRAGYHRAKQLQVPENIRLVFLPSSNPELNPVERFWEDMKDRVAFHNFKDEQELEEWIASTVREYSKEQVASLTGYPYIKRAVREATQNME
ncbi:IS630 family transposase [Pontibacter qinzhouensis]|uniref:IS630 family transposase n=1 Tax=Pontibacter qinzhouensis TaxID=2603253 RepID=A0A5C8KA67_9BACT|nr:IS630 family transposase [Pontibacter qinzhouensis]TXK45727.1 IS630 family transposase [Pontibacter qinzhouensis]